VRRWNHRLAIPLLIAAGASPALAQQGSADLTRGQELAANMCSFCHDVTRDQSGQTLDETPSFVRIASKPYQSPEAVAESIIFPPSGHAQSLEIGVLVILSSRRREAHIGKPIRPLLGMHY
jgi:hypothetical protein